MHQHLLRPERVLETRSQRPTFVPAPGVSGKSLRIEKTYMLWYYFSALSPLPCSLFHISFGHDQLLRILPNLKQ